MQMDIKPIRNEANYRQALNTVKPYFAHEPEPDSVDGERFEILLTLIEAYEAKHFPIDLPDPVEAIKFRMEQAGLTPKDLESMIGQRNRVYEVLNRKRPLTLKMIRNLHTQLNIPAESLLK